MMRRYIAGIAAAVILAIAGPASAQDTKLTIMVFQGMQNLPIFAAQSKGFLAKRGITLDVKIAPSSDEMRAGLADGKWQIIHTAVDNGVAMQETGKGHIVIVSGGDNSFNHVIAQSDIGTFADIKGKTVIVDAPDTAYAFQLYEILKRAGLKKDTDYQVKIVGATFKRLDDLEKNKDSKASMLNPPFSLRAVKAGMKDMGTVAKLYGPYQATGAVVMRDWATKNSDTLVKYLQAYIEGLRWSLDPKNKDEAIKLLADGLKLPPDVAATTYAVAVDPKEGLAKDAKFDMKGFQERPEAARRLDRQEARQSDAIYRHDLLQPRAQDGGQVKLKQASGQLQVALDGVRQSDRVDREHHFCRDVAALEAAAVGRVADGLFNLTLGGHADLLEKLAERDVERFFVHRVSPIACLNFPDRPAS